MTTNTMGRDEAGKAIRKRAMEGCPLARELLILRGMCSCQGDEKSVDDAEDRYLELAVLRDAVPALQAEIERLREALRELEGREQRDKALLRQALEALEQIARDLPWELTGLQADTIAALRERLGEGAEP